ncbi:MULTISPECIES: allophanate hydrolase [unclassified Halomonas]|uniref:allophanate hydrolase n=1 Tax=unclassified Halomonas TaxID=2609666 RepID=UPI0021E41D0D|nr:MULTISPECIES: allophanate hydrolase [unclassified Halomonas]UYF98614.1 allophanate hydrolase [Halomonas sp. GD1P12]WNL40272.1 allophanate hydrolase [Halomonas sp. PAMB 3232]
MTALRPLDIKSLHQAYSSGELTPASLIDELLDQAERLGPNSAWITRLTREQLTPYLQKLEEESPATLPLYGVPFAIKDNIDLAGVPTTAGSPAYAYTPDEHAFVVQQLIDAGALPLGKTNLDQFATGLVGERALDVYGTPANAFDPTFIPGGSSSGSAVVTAAGMVSFALGTDTAGSGRVPACFNNLYGVKPSLGLLSTRGVVPACATLDTISLFTLTCDDAAALLALTAVYDEQCAWSRRFDFAVQGQRYGQPPAAFRFGVPLESQWQTDAAYTQGMHQAITKLEALGGEKVELDCTPLLAAARLLYEGPWVAERYHVIQKLMAESPKAVHPVTFQITQGGATPLAVDAFDARYKLAEYKRQADALIQQVDVMLSPTTVTHPSKAEVAKDPIGANSRLGIWTNFMNLLDYSALAVPIGFTERELPVGVTLFGPAFADLQLLSLARALEARTRLPLGASGIERPAIEPLATPAQNGTMEIVVCGAHLEGLPLNHQLTERGGIKVESTQSAPRYKLYALAGGPPARPAMVRDEQGQAIEVEVWRLPIDTVGSFLAGIPVPLGLGQVELADGSWKCGFICSAGALNEPGPARDVSDYGGWRGWLKQAK